MQLHEVINLARKCYWLQSELPPRQNRIISYEPQNRLIFATIQKAVMSHCKGQWEALISVDKVAQCSLFHNQLHSEQQRFRDLNTWQICGVTESWADVYIIASYLRAVFTSGWTRRIGIYTVTCRYEKRQINVPVSIAAFKRHQLASLRIAHFHRNSSDPARCSSVTRQRQPQIALGVEIQKISRKEEPSRNQQWHNYLNDKGTN